MVSLTSLLSINHQLVVLWIVSKVADLINSYGEGLQLIVTNSITSAGVYNNYTASNGKYPNGIVPLGTSSNTPTLYVQPPAFTITSNVTGSSDPSDYSVGDMTAKPAFAFVDATHPLAIVSVPFIQKAKPGGWPIWVWALIIVLILVVIAIIIAGVMMGYKKYKNR